MENKAIVTQLSIVTYNEQDTVKAAEALTRVSVGLALDDIDIKLTMNMVDSDEESGVSDEEI